MLCEVAALPLQTHAYYENWSIALNLSKQFVDNSSKIGYVVVSYPPSIYLPLLFISLNLYFRSRVD